MSGTHCQQHPPTLRQLEALWHVQQHQERRGYPISIRDLCDALGVASTNGVAECVRALCRKGLAEKDVFVARSLRVTPLGARFLSTFTPSAEGGRASFNLGRSAAPESKATSHAVNEGEG